MRHKNANMRKLGAEILNDRVRGSETTARTVQHQIKLDLFDTVETFHETLDITVGDRDQLWWNSFARLGPLGSVENQRALGRRILRSDVFAPDEVQRACWIGALEIGYFPENSAPGRHLARSPRAR